MQQDDPFLPSEREFWDFITMISRRAVAEALDLRYRQVEPLLADVDEVDSTVGMPVGEKIDLVDELRIATDPSSGSRLSLYGEPAVREDRKIDEFKRDLVRDYLGDMIRAHAGEESDEPQWQEFLHLPSGQLGLLDDAVDGTKSLRMSRDAFSSNMCVYRSRGTPPYYELLGGVCTNATGETMHYDLAPGSVTMISPSGLRLPLSKVDLPSDRSAPGTLAIVAARGESRQEFAELLDPSRSFALPPAVYGSRVVYDPGLETYLTGGAPKLITWPLSECQYLVIPHDQTPYDAAPLPGALLAGNSTYYVAETGAPASLEEVISWMNVVTGPTGGTPRPVKAGLLVRANDNPETTRLILGILRDVAARSKNRT